MMNESRIDARLYSLIHRGTPGDVTFYRDVCRGARSVLELGSGTGRVQLALAADGLEVTGIDVDRGHLEYARSVAGSLATGVRERVRFLHADMRDFDLGRTFDRVIAPYHVLFVLLDRSDLAACLDRVRAHLAPRGRFAADGYLAPDRLARFGSRAGRFGPLRPLVQVQDGSTAVRVFERERIGEAAGRIDVEYVFHLHEPGRGVDVRRRTIRHRIVRPDELIREIERSGMEVIQGPDERDLGDGATGFTVVAGLAAPG